MTQGLLTLTENGETKIKVIVGCNGMKIEKLKKEILAKELKTIDEIYEQALESDFGCEDCLVVMDKENIKFRDGEEELLTLYREKFVEPKFNPRWEHGTADYIEVVELTAKSL